MDNVSGALITVGRWVLEHLNAPVEGCQYAHSKERWSGGWLGSCWFFKRSDISLTGGKLNNEESVFSHPVSQK